MSYMFESNVIICNYINAIVIHYYVHIRDFVTLMKKIFIRKKRPSYLGNTYGSGTVTFTVTIAPLKQVE